MSSLYSEAIVEAKKLRELAYNNARDKLVESIEPKLKSLIEEQLLSEDEDSPVQARDDDDDDILLDLAGSPEGGDDVSTLGLDEPAGITLPDEEGKVTLDLDDFVVDDGQEAVSDEEELNLSGDVSLSVESAQLLAALLGVKGPAGRSTDALSKQVGMLEARCAKLVSASAPKAAHIKQNLREVEHTYCCIREAANTSKATKKALGDRLERVYSSLNEAADKMARNTAKTIDESDIKVRLSGLPDDVELDDVTADAAPSDDSDGEDDIGDLESPEGNDDMDYDMKDEADDMADEKLELDESDLEITVSGLPDDVDTGELSVDVEPADEEGGEEDFELGGEEGGDDLELSDDDVVEIPEAMLRQEMARARRRASARRLAEDGPGGAPGPKEFDDFGDASKEADVFVDYDDGDLNKNESRRARARRLSRPASRQQRVNEARLVRQNRQLKAALAEANLFNAKMVYANKLLQREGLSDRQKARIVENLDKARTLHEVKLLYKGLVESLAPKAGLRESTQARRVLGSSSRPARSGGSSQKETLSEASSQVSRWGTLAGLIKETV